MVAHTFISSNQEAEAGWSLSQPSGGRGRWISEFEASLVYKVSSRTARATQRNPVLRKTKNKKQTNKKKDIENKNEPDPWASSLVMFYLLCILPDDIGYTEMWGMGWWSVFYRWLFGLCFHLQQIFIVFWWLRTSSHWNMPSVSWHTLICFLLRVQTVRQACLTWTVYAVTCDRG